MPALTELPALIELELNQRADEGCDTSAIRVEFEALPAADAGEDRLLEILASLDELLPAKDYPYAEPSDVVGIAAARSPGGGVQLEVQNDLADRVLGAWLGRCAGCLLGKPVEGWSRDEIVRYLMAAGEYPLARYFPLLDPNPAGRPLHRSARESTRVGIECMPRDDDIDYTILGLHLMEDHGLGFTTADVGHEWLTHLPYELVYTAERAAYRNLVDGCLPPATATRLNPYREWIGAQIRADIYGYVAPGRPRQAADLAFRDAALSHVKNGIYGAMFVAGAVAAAFAVDSAEQAIRAGLAQIPASSRLFEALSNTLAWSATHADWRDALARVMDAYGHYHRVHTINNACFVVLGLLYGGGDLGRTIAIAVECGMDTDCNGATAGSIAGAMLGARAMPRQWTDPLNDRVRSIVAGFDNSAISVLAARTLKLGRR